jgi:ABC-type multidrug transport system permease subunit
MLNLFLGAITVVAFVLLFNYLQKNGIVLKWWGWLLTILGLLFALLTVATILGFIGEGFPMAALVIGGMLTVAAVIWGVVMARFVYKKA